MTTEPPTETFLDNLKAQVNNQPLHRFLGLQVRRYAQGRASTALKVGSNTLNAEGVIDEGPLSILGNVASRFAVATLLGEGRIAMNVEQRLTILSPTKSGLLVAKAKVTSLRARLARINFRIFDSESEEVANGDMICYILPRDQFTTWRWASPDVDAPTSTDIPTTDPEDNKDKELDEDDED